jgi:hypothetical protein
LNTKLISLLLAVAPIMGELINDVQALAKVASENEPAQQKLKDMVSALSTIFAALEKVL